MPPSGRAGGPWSRRGGRLAAWAVLLAAMPAVAHAVPADSTASAASAVSHPVPADSAASDTSGFVIRVDEGRKRGEFSLEALLLQRRPIALARLPSDQPLFGAPILLDAGGSVRPEGSPYAGERATDRTIVGSSKYLTSAPSLAIASTVPETEGIDPFDLVAIDSSLAPGPFRAAGELFTRPRAVLFDALALPDPPAPQRVRSALLYRRGAGSLLDTGARFSSPLFARGVAASYVRHAADAPAPLLGSVATRYHAAAGLTRGTLRSWVEGRLFQVSMETDIPGGYDASLGLVDHARAEWAAREATLHADWRGSRLRADGSLRAAKAQATQVGYANERERWVFPEISGTGRVAGAVSGAWSWSLSGEASSRRIEYREDSLPAFRPRFGAARVVAGVRRERDESGLAVDVAADLREGDAALVDGRVSFWSAPTGREGLRLRVDAEAAHERPSFVDLLAPARADTYLVFLPGKTLVLRRSGNPELRARALRGVLAAASLDPAPGVTVFAFGSARHVSGDFGWDLRRSETIDTIFLDDVAVERGDGWVFHAAGGGDAVLGPLTARGLAWVRGGRHGLSPQAGSPARAGLDAAVGVRGAFFQGDLPLALELEAHATGPRRGFFAAPAMATWDARLRADFGAAGIAATVTNLFDARVPSALYRIEDEAGVPLTGRALSVGVVWYLFD